MHSQAIDLADEYVNRKIERDEFEKKLKGIADKVPHDFNWFNSLFLQAKKLHDSKHLLVRFYDWVDTSKKDSLLQKVFDESNDFIQDEVSYFSSKLAKQRKRGVITEQVLLSD